MFQMVDAVLPVIKSQEGIQCHPSLWQHVYNTLRLSEKDVIKAKETSCVTVRGTLIYHKPHADGDTHMWVKLDPGYGKYLTQKSGTVCLNHAGQKICNLLIAEAVCQNPVSPALLVKVVPPDTCKQKKGTYLDTKVPIPQDGSRVCITGSWVTDDQHKKAFPKGWAEIHPVSNIHRVHPTTGKC